MVDDDDDDDKHILSTGTVEFSLFKYAGITH